MSTLTENEHTTFMGRKTNVDSAMEVAIVSFVTKKVDSRSEFLVRKLKIKHVVGLR